MYHILSCSFPAPAATHESVINAAWVWLQSTVHYSFPALAPCVSAVFPFRQRYDGGANHLELLGCVMDRTEYTALRLTKPDMEKNVVWTTDMIFEKPADDGQPRICVELRRNPIDGREPCVMTDPPHIPGLIPMLRKKGQISTADLSLPCILLNAKTKCGNLRHQVVPLARIERAAEPLPENVALRVVWENCGVTKDLCPCEDPDVLANEAAIEVFRLVGQMYGDFGVSFEMLERLCPRTDTALPDSNVNYCFMNKPMAEKLRSVRREQGMSQRDLARAVNVTNLVISRLETMRVSRAPVSLIRNVEQALGLHADAILSLQKARTEPPVPAAAAPEVPQPVQDEAVPPRKNRFCRLCGAKLYEDSRFCSSCGAGVLP